MRSGQTIYLDYQATTPVDHRVFDAMEPYLKTEFGNPHSDDHFMGWKSNKAVLDSQQKIAKFIGADYNDIIFTSGATESNNLAILGIASQSTTRKRILVSTIEHKCVLEAAIASKQYGCIIQKIPVDRQGFIDFVELEKAMGPDVLLISIMAANNEIGTLQNLNKISGIAHYHGALFHTDAAQLGLASEINVTGSGVDIMSLSSHKIYGPKGIGALYLDSSLKERIKPMIHGGGQQNGLRSGTVPTFLCVGFAAAAEILTNRDSADERNSVANLRDRFEEYLFEAEISFEINGPDRSVRHPCNLNVTIEGIDAHSVLGAMQPYVCASTGSACNSGNIEPSYVLEAIGHKKKEAAATIRFSFGRYSTDDQVADAAAIFCKQIQQAQKYI